MYLLWAVNTLKEVSHHTQVIKVWNIVEQHDCPRISKQLEAVYKSYTSDEINRCKYKHREGYVLSQIHYFFRWLCVE